MKKWIICVIAFSVMLILFTSACSTFDVGSVIGTEAMNVENFRAIFMIEETDLTQVTTFSSYVFIAEVVSYEWTEYLSNESEMPVTCYKVRVKENIKGHLVKDTDIEIKKRGGLIRGTKSFSVCVGDILPRPGKTYLFASSIFNDDLYCSMPNMVVEITADESDYLNDETVKKYIAACETVAEGVENGNKNKSRYDAGDN